MKTSELLEHTAGPILDDRANLLEGANDQLFAESTILRYLNEAESLLCRDGLVLEDRSTPAVCEIALNDTDQEYDLHPSILIVRAARLSDTDLDLTRVGYDDNRWLISSLAEDDTHWDVNHAFTANPGRPSRYSTDMGAHILRLSDIPDADTAALKLYLRVIRLPLKPLASDEPDRAPEVPEQYHLDLCRYAAGSCLLNTADVDAELRSLGRGWVNDFRAMASKAKRDKQRLHQSRPRIRFRGWVNDAKRG